MLVPKDRRRDSAKARKILNNSDSSLLTGFIICIIVALTAGVLLTNFFEKVHYNNELGQDSAKVTSLQLINQSQASDLKFLITNSKTAINCYDLNSAVAKSLCSKQNN
jgi:hypothetical protein